MSPIHFVKICGITRAEDAILAMKLGADAIGFIFYPESKRFISIEAAGAIAQALQENDNNFNISEPDDELENNILITGVFVNPTLAQIKNAVKIARLDVIQLHGAETPEFVRSVRTEFPHLVFIKAVRLGTSEITTAYPVDFLLLDHAGPEWGGSGKAVDFSQAKNFIVQSELPVILAGGLNSENILEAIKATAPNGVDLSSGVEVSPGIKSADKLKELFRVLNRERHNGGAS